MELLGCFGRVTMRRFPPIIFLTAVIWYQQDYRLEKKWSAVGFCSGAISGLVAITPASGFVGARKYLIPGPTNKLTLV